MNTNIMSVKFVSKQSNYMVVLRPGTEGNRALGVHTVPGIYVKFQAGIVDVKDDSIAKMMREHSAFGTDYIEIKPTETDPFIDTREDIEPEHSIAEIKYGHVEKKAGRPAKVKLTPQMKKVIESEALKMLPDLLKSNPKVLQGIIVSLAADMKAKEAPKEEGAAKAE